MKISVIVPTRDRADILQRCLSSLARQTFSTQAFEVIVIDNGSGDHTKAVADAFSGSLQLVYSRKDEPGLHVGRHEGFRLARTDMLAFVDDDVEAEDGWLEAINKAFLDPDVAMIGGNNYPAFEIAPPTWLRQLWERPIYKGRALSILSVLDFGKGQFEIDPRFVWGCNFSVRRRVLAEAGGFHPDGLPKDKIRFRGDGESHVARHLRSSRQKALFDSRASVHHFVPKERMTIAYFGQRAFAQGVSDSYTAIRRAGRVPVIPYQLWQCVRQAKSFCSHHLSRRASSDVTDVLNTIRHSYWQGFWFHMKEAAKDRALLAWVVKESYF